MLPDGPRVRAATVREHREVIFFALPDHLVSRKAANAFN